MYNPGMEIERPRSKQPIPVDAKCVFKGVMFDVYQWRQKMFDGSYETFEKLKRPDTASVVPVLPDGTVLLVEEEQPGLAKNVYLPAGRIEPGEDPLAGAKRELMEETGYASDKWELWYAYQPVTKLDWAIFYFIAKDCKRTSEPHPDAGERITLLPVGLDEFLARAARDKLLGGELATHVLESRYDPVRMKSLRQRFLP